ncbi:MAG: S41 family peptidase [Dehalococcoidia bacterium]|nr:S41 family peptidase [Dehalococcoidia bacterium]
MNKSFIVSVVMVLSLLCTSLPLFGCDAPFVPSEVDKETLKDLPTEFQIQSEAWQKLQQYYVDQEEIDPTKISQGAVRGMVQAVGDPYTDYYSPDEYQSTMIGLTGVFQGIGATIEKKSGYIAIVAPIAGSPADQAGLQTGDLILKINGESTEGMNADIAAQKIRGPAGSKVTLTIGREGERDTFDVDIVRSEIKMDSVKSEMRGDVAYISISHFILPTAEDFSVALKKALDEGARGLILDLRSNPGGILTQAIDVASQFLVRGVVVKVIDKNGTESVQKVRGGGIATDVPLIVLIDKGSASASEIVAGALHDNERAKLAGEKSYGKASVQNIVKLSDGSAIKITTAHYYTPNGTLISGKGLMPDYPTSLLGDNLTKWAEGYIDDMLAGEPIEVPPAPEISAADE